MTKENKVVKTDLPIRPLADGIPGLLSRGTVLEVEIGGTFTQVAAVTSIPDIGGTPAEVDVTHLGSERMVNIPGLQDADTLDFECVYQGANWSALLPLDNDGLQHSFRITYPDEITCTFTGSLALTMGGIGVNEAMNFTVSVTVSAGPNWE